MQCVDDSIPRQRGSPVKEIHANQKYTEWLGVVHKEKFCLEEKRQEGAAFLEELASQQAMDGWEISSSENVLQSREGT